MLCRCGSRLRRVLSGAAVHTGKGCGQGVAGAKSACDERLNHPGSRGGDAQLNARRRGGGRPWQAGSVAGRCVQGVAGAKSACVTRGWAGHLVAGRQRTELM